MTHHRAGVLRRTWVVGLIFAAACSSGDDGGASVDELLATAPTTTTVPATNAPTTVAPTTEATTTVAPTTTAAPSTTRATTTTIQRTTTTVNPDDEVIVRLAGIEATRDRFLDIIEDNFVLERVDVFTVDLRTTGAFPTAAITLSGTSGYGTPEIQLEQTWKLIGLLAEFWTKDGLLRNDEGSLLVSTDVTVDGRRFVAPYELMVRVAERRVTFDAFVLEAFT